MVHKLILRVNNIIFTSYSFSIILVQHHTILHNNCSFIHLYPNSIWPNYYDQPQSALLLSLQCIIFMFKSHLFPQIGKKVYFSSHLSISTLVATIGIARYATFVQSYKTRELTYLYLFACWTALLSVTVKD